MVVSLARQHLLRRLRSNTAIVSSALSNHRLVAASFFFAFLVGSVIYCHTASFAAAAAASIRSPGTMSSSSPVFSLLVTLNFAAAEHKEQFLTDIRPLAEYVRSSEPDTVAYEVLLSDKDPLQVLILERYKDKDNAFMKVHRSSEPFLAFRPKLQAMQEDGNVKIDGNSYLDAGVGFGDRS